MPKIEGHCGAGKEDGEEDGDETSSQHPADKTCLPRARRRSRPRSWHSIAGATVHRATAVAGHRAQTSTASRESRLDLRK